MIALMGAVLLAILVLGTAALAGHPLYLIVLAALLGGLVLFLGRRRPGHRMLRRH
jgi:hypothetical protein